MMAEWIRISPTPKNRRLRVLRIVPEMFLHLLTPDGTRLIRQRGIPADAEIIGLEHNLVAGTIDFLIHSEQFEPMDIGQASTWAAPLEVSYEELLVVEAGR